MAHVEILRGISGSGKSTYARTQTDALIVSRDLIRPMFGVVGKTVLSPEKERLVTRIELDLIREALYRGQDVIVDNTNLNGQFATRYAELAHTMGATFSEKLFGVDVNVAVGRTDVPDSVVYRQAAQFAKIKPIVPRVPEPIRPIVMGEDYPEAIIVDVDGTLAHNNPDSPRDPYDVSRAHEDLVDETLVKMLNALSYHYFIYIVTGRGLRHRQVTEEWLYNHCVPYYHLWTRPDNDTSVPDAWVKYQIAKEIARTRNIVGVFDDRERVVDMWRAAGIKTFDVGQGIAKF